MSMKGSELAWKLRLMHRFPKIATIAPMSKSCEELLLLL
jgi:hypothetical protein